MSRDLLTVEQETTLLRVHVNLNTQASRSPATVPRLPEDRQRRVGEARRNLTVHQDSEWGLGHRAPPKPRRIVLTVVEAFTVSWIHVAPLATTPPGKPLAAPLHGLKT